MNNVLSPEEYKIYNDLLEKHKVYATILGSGEIDRIVIRHTTSIGPVTLDEMIRFVTEIRV